MFQLWSAGNVRIQKLDLTILAMDAIELVDALKGDNRVSLASPYPSACSSIGVHLLGPLLSDWGHFLLVKARGRVVIVGLEVMGWVV